VTRIKPFEASIELTAQLLREAPDAVEVAKGTLARNLSGTLTGPRGGRYEPFGDIRFTGPHYQFTRDTYYIVAQRKARYVRPQR
jgi:hypothetical protein